MTDAAGGRLGGGLPVYVGRYRVLERIGRGAMGVVYAARDEQLDRRVAVKLMLADFDQEPDMRQRFYREAKITGQLTHRNIVTVFDLGEERGRPFIVMELLEGLQLAEHLVSGGSQSIDARIDLMMQVCEGLQNAHRCGVIHRDLKPSNLFVQKDGSLKILDFGVARLTASNLTASGFLVGTPEYMSPEQPQGRPVDARSDVFSAGSVFYFILTGRSPFGSRDLLKMLDAILYETPPALTDEEAPEALRQVLNKAMAKSPADRYQQCAEMYEDLARVRRGLQGNNQRFIQAARDRFRDILAVIDERRSLGHMLGVAGIDVACDTDAERLRRRFGSFAPDAPAMPMTPMDRAAVQSALASLQSRLSTERAALAAMKEQVVDPRDPPLLRAPETTAASDSGTSFWRGLWRRGGPSRS